MAKCKECGFEDDMIFGGLCLDCSQGTASEDDPRPTEDWDETPTSDVYYQHLAAEEAQREANRTSSEVPGESEQRSYRQAKEAEDQWRAEHLDGLAEVEMTNAVEDVLQSDRPDLRATNVDDTAWAHQAYFDTALGSIGANHYYAATVDGERIYMHTYGTAGRYFVPEKLAERLLATAQA